MKDFKPMVKMQAGGTVAMSPYASVGPLGGAKPGGPTAPSVIDRDKIKPYKSGGKRKKNAD
jgi:hypothetical protein